MASNRDRSKDLKEKSVDGKSVPSYMMRDLAKRNVDYSKILSKSPEKARDLIAKANEQVNSEIENKKKKLEEVASKARISI